MQENCQSLIDERWRERKSAINTSWKISSESFLARHRTQQSETLSELLSWMQKCFKCENHVLNDYMWMFINFVFPHSKKTNFDFCRIFLLSYHFRIMKQIFINRMIFDVCFTSTKAFSIFSSLICLNKNSIYLQKFEKIYFLPVYWVFLSAYHMSGLFYDKFTGAKSWSLISTFFTFAPSKRENNFTFLMN